MTEENKFIYCSKCGKQNSKGNKFCTNCGNKLITIEDSIKNTTENIKDVMKNNQTHKSFAGSSYDENSRVDFDNSNMVNFIQKNAEYYILKFKEIQELYKTTSWNWAAFFFNSWWFLYRKMYAIGFGIMAVSLLVGTIMPYLSLIFSIVVTIVSGLYGNGIYLKHIQNQLDSISNVEEHIKQRIILNKGGVNLVIPIILAIVTIVFFLLIGAAIYLYPSLYYYYY